MAQREISVEQVRKKAARFHRIFTSPDGAKCLEDLDAELNPDELFDPTGIKTEYNVGRRDAFIYIQQLIRYEENARRIELEG